MTAKKTKNIAEPEAPEVLASLELMVVDDETSMRALLRDFLSSQGYRVNCFASGGAALKAIQSGRNPLALVSHVRMQPMDGLALLKNIRKDYPSLPVILYTGACSPKEKSHALDLGANGYLAKPFSLLTLKQILEGAHGTRPPNKK